MSFRGKPLIVAPRPWWRHRIFPWGWYSLSQDALPTYGEMNADGHYSPNDGGGGPFVWSPNAPDNSGGIIKPSGGDTAGKA